MAPKVQLSSTDIHVRLLYLITLLLTTLIATTVWMGYTELKRLKILLDDKVSKSEVVNFKIKDIDFGQDDQILPSTWSNTNGRQEFSGVNNNDEMKTTRERRHAVEGSGSANPDEWAWLSGYARIPLVALKSFCIQTKEYCAASGPPGPPGSPGTKGDRGSSGFPGVSGPPGQKGESADPGLVAMNLRSDEYLRGPPGQKGEMGLTGPMGPTGPPGLTGPKGEPGFNGTDGKDGQTGPTGPVGPPGKPGLPGKDGMDGMNGVAGLAGRNGTDGQPGKRGKRGDTGPPGEKGERGTSGVPGVPGLKGRKGDTGDRGWPGEKGDCFCDITDTGSRGPRGSKGDKGDRGFCEVHCVDNLRKMPPSTSTSTTTVATTTVIPTIPPRTRYCRIKIIGKPLYEYGTGSNYGTWMKDPYALTDSNRQKIWVTLGNYGDKLYEYNNKKHFEQGVADKLYNLGNIPYYGTGHVVYRGSFYYQAKGWNKLVRYDLKVGSAMTLVDLPGSSFRNDRFLYNTGESYYDFAVDENGLWIIYSQESGSDKLHIARLTPKTLEVMKKWELDIDRGSYGNGIILCGIAYFMKSGSRVSTYIDYAFDIYEEQQISPFERLRFTNPYELNVMVSYNPHDQNIYAWDNGNQIRYPMLLN